MDPVNAVEGNGRLTWREWLEGVQPSLFAVWTLHVLRLCVRDCTSNCGVERLTGLMMVLFRVIDRKCVASTGLTGEVEESVQLPLHSMTEGSVRARDGVEEWGVMLLR